MALDPSIIGGLTLPKINTPAENAVAAAAQRRAAMQQQADEVKLRAGQQELAERDAFVRALRSAPDLSDETLDGLTKVAPSVAMEFRAKLQQQRTAAMTAAKAQADLDAKQAERGLALLSIADEDSWPTLAPTIAKLVPDLAPVLPRQFDPATLDKLRRVGMSQKEQLDADRAALEGLFSGKYGSLAAALAKVTDPAERKERVQSWGFLGVPRSVLAALEADPESFTMTPDQRADNERAAATAKAAAEDRAADNARQAATQAETLRHNRVVEGQGAQRIAAAGANGGQKPLTANAESNIINRLTTQWGAATKNAQELDRQIELMEAGLRAARAGNMAQGSQTVLVTFQKILDPTSVVRESEFDRSAAGQSLINRIKGAATRVAEGGNGVTLAELEKFAALAREARAAQTKNLGRVRDRLGKTADRYNIPRELVLDDVGGVPTAAPAAGGETVIDGYKVRVKGGR